MKAVLFGSSAHELEPEIAKRQALRLVECDPDIVICWGGDGTLLRAEREWPGVPKVPIRNSRRGNRCIAHPPGEVLDRLLEGALARTEYLKLEGTVRRADGAEAAAPFLAINELNVHMGRINAAVRFRLTIDGEPYAEGEEIIGDGFVISTPFGSSAYFNQITRGLFYTGLGIGLKSPWAQTTHVIVPETAVIRVAISRGPAVLAHDNATEYLELNEGDELTAKRHAQPAVLFTWASMSHPSDEF